MIVVTGGAGFIGANLARHLVGRGADVLVVDDVDPRSNGGHLRDVELAGFVDKDEYLSRLLGDPTVLDGVDAVLHQGACSSTTVDDEDFLRRNNVEWSVAVLDACLAAGVPLIYASSASVYGTGPAVDGVPIEADRPLNAYARSKAAFDRVVEERLAAPGGTASQVVGLRYFNVYGPGESHKGPMASMVHQAARQVAGTGEVRIFGAGAGAEAGQHRRDFVAVEDVIAVIDWFLGHPDASGIFNCGTGESWTFQELAEIVVDRHGSGRIAHVDFPAWLEPRYQAATRAELTRLRLLGCDVSFTLLADGIAACLADHRGPWGGLLP